MGSSHTQIRQPNFDASYSHSSSSAFEYVKDECIIATTTVMPRQKTETTTHGEKVIHDANRRAFEWCYNLRRCVIETVDGGRELMRMNKTVPQTIAGYKGHLV